MKLLAVGFLRRLPWPWLELQKKEILIIYYIVAPPEPQYPIGLALLLQ
jgi:hypothetical protein